MGEIKLLVEAFTVKSIVESKVESGVNLIERRSWVPQFLKDGTTINIMKKSIILVGLIGIAPIVNKDILDPAATFTLFGYMDGLANRGCWRQRRSIHRKSRV